jgi:hypothetical protein
MFRLSSSVKIPFVWRVSSKAETTKPPARPTPVIFSAEVVGVDAMAILPDGQYPLDLEQQSAVAKDRAELARRQLADIESADAN